MIVAAIVVIVSVATAFFTILGLAVTIGEEGLEARGVIDLDDDRVGGRHGRDVDSEPRSVPNRTAWRSARTHAAGRPTLGREQQAQSTSRPDAGGRS